MSRRRWSLVGLVGVLAGLKAAQDYFVAGAVWSPDFFLYSQGGLGLYPSPGGRLLGALGPDGLGAVHVASVAALPVLAALVARRRGHSPLAAAVAFALAPLAVLTLAHASADSAGLVLLAASLLCGGLKGRVGFALAAALVHAALFPFALLAVLELGRAYWLPAGALLFPPAALALWLTPYMGVLESIGTAAFFVGFATTAAAALALSPAVLFGYVRRRSEVVAWAGAAGLCAGLQSHFHVRYALPVLFIAAVNLGASRRSSLREWRINGYVLSGPAASVPSMTTRKAPGQAPPSPTLDRAVLAHGEFPTP